jgi:two-component system KDP operon response regulator KdpE
MKPSILVIDDEPQIRRALRDGLEAEGYVVQTAESGETALADLPLSPPDLVILDLGLPGMSGLEVCSGVRRVTSAPILILTVRSLEADKVAALDLGADDYLTKPFGMDELLARARAHLRRWQDAPGRHGKLHTRDLTLDPETRTATVRGEEVKLTPIEYEILRFLMMNTGRVVTRERIQQHVWGCVYEADVHALHVHITNLRKKIEPEPARPKYLRTELGVGYRFVELQ